jgi:tetratricopeptide (TPR) repeat protein
MRAWLFWLALVPCLVLAGCRSPRGRLASDDSSGALPARDENLAEALAHYSQALVSDVTLGEASSAFLHYREAAARDPRHLALTLKVALDHLARKEYRAAIAVLDRAAAYHPDSLDLLLMRAAAWQALGAPRECERALRRAIRIAPTRPEGYVRLASLRASRMDPDGALEVIRDGLSRGVQPNQALLELTASLGRIYLLGGQGVQAARFLEPWVRASPDQPAAREWLARAYALAGETGKALAEIDQVAAAQPGNSQVALLQGELREVSGDWVGAGASYRRALEGQPPDPMAFLKLAGVELRANLEAGVKVLEAGVLAFPADSRLRVFLGLMYTRLNRAPDAVREFARVEESLAGDRAPASSLQPLFYFWYGGACEEVGRRDEAERLMKKCLELAPDTPEALNYLAYLWAEDGRNLDRAEAYARKALARAPRNGAFWDTLGWIHYRRGEQAKAAKCLTRALTYAGDDPVILEHAGDVWKARGKPAKAIEFWRRSLEARPEAPGVRGKLIREGVTPESLPAPGAPPPAP